MIRVLFFWRWEGSPKVEPLRRIPFHYVPVSMHEWVLRRATSLNNCHSPFKRVAPSKLWQSELKWVSTILLVNWLDITMDIRWAEGLISLTVESWKFSYLLFLIWWIVKGYYCGSLLLNQLPTNSEWMLPWTRAMHRHSKLLNAIFVFLTRLAWPKRVRLRYLILRWHMFTLICVLWIPFSWIMRHDMMHTAIKLIFYVDELVLFTW